MIQKCILACYEKNTKNCMLNNLRSFYPKLEIIITENEEALAVSLKNYKAITVYVDKIFLGIFLKEKIEKLRAINPNVNFVFVEQGSCPVYLGIRIHKLGANGFICGIEDKNAVKAPFFMTFQQMIYFPDEVHKALHDIFYIKERKLYSEATAREVEIAFCKYQGKSIKEICVLENNITPGTISKHIYRLNSKTGCKNVKELFLLIESTHINETVI